MRLLIIILMCCCSLEGNYLIVVEGVEMTIPYQVKVGASEQKQETDIKELIANAFKEVDLHYNNWNPSSEISQFNHWPAHRPFKLSSKLESFLQLCSHYVKETEGRFDPTIAPLYRLWKESLEKGGRPSKKAIDKVCQYTGWQHLQIKDGDLIKTREGVELDLGGIAKGYAVDLLVEALEQKGYKNIFVSWGGEIKTKGKHPSGRSWRAGIRFWEPANEGIVELQEQALATSGDYLQYWEIQEGMAKHYYTHIIDIKAKQPLVITPYSLSSVSILAPSCLQADILATCSLLCTSPDELQQWLEKKPSISKGIRVWAQSHEKEEQKSFIASPL